MVSIRKIAMIVASIVCLSAHAMESQRITKENLLSIAPRLDAQQEEIVTRWRDEHSGLLATLNMVDRFNDLPDLLQLNNRLIEDYGFQNISSTGNYTIRIPDTAWKVRVAGQINKMFTAIVGNSTNERDENGEHNKKMNYRDTLRSTNPTNYESDPRYLEALKELREFRHQQYLKYIAKNGTTFQNISRLAHQQKTAQAQKELKWSRIKVAEAYPVAYKGQENATMATDETHFIVEEFDPSFKTVNIDSPEFKELSPETFVELIQAVQAGYLWNQHDNLAVCGEDGKTIIITDFEQPNRANPNGFFLADENTLNYFELITCCAIAELIKKAPSAEHFAAAKSYILSNEALQKFSNFKAIAALINS